MIRHLSKYKSYLLSFLLTLGMILGVTIFAAEPTRTLGFQGQLFDNNAPLTSNVNATFTFYDAPTDGNITGTPVPKVVTVSNGYFGVQFTESDTTGIDFNQQLYIEVSINGTTLSPRTSVNPTVSSLKSFGTFSYTSAPSVGPSGSLYFNTMTQELYVSNGSSWQLSGLASSTTQWVANGTSLNYMAGNVGIGTTTPDTNLEILGDSYLGTGYPILRLTSKGNSAGQIQFFQPDSTAGTNRKNFGLVFSTYLDTQLQATGTALTFQSRTDTGGFGSTLMALTSEGRLVLEKSGAALSPETKFVVAGENATSSQVTLRSSRSAIVAGNVIGGINFSSNDSSLTSPGSTTASIQALANTTHTASALGTDLVFSTTNGTTTNAAMRILGNGNVGIGTSAPLSTLHVAGTSSINWVGLGSSSGLVTVGTGGTAGGSLWVNTPSQGSSYHSGLGISGSYASNVSTVNITAYGANASPYRSVLSFGTTKNAAVSENMRIDGLTGFVGIATTTPISTLTVDGSFTVASSTALSTFVGNMAIGSNPVTASGTLAIKPFTNQTQLFLQQDNSSSLGFGLWMDSSSGQLKFVRAGVNILTLGTNASSSSTFLTPLIVSGDLSANNISMGAGYKLNFSNGSEIKRITSDGHMQYLSQNGIHEIAGTIQTGQITATSTVGTSTFAGSVGIGTTTPFTALSVVGTSYFSGSMGIGSQALARKLVIGASSDTLTGIQINANSTSWYLDHRGSNDAPNNRFGISTGATEFFTILSGGNVGIGTTTPRSKLNIEGGQLTIGDVGTLGDTYISAVNTRGILFGKSAATQGLEYIASGSGSGYGFRIATTDPSTGVVYLNFDKRSNTGTFSTGMTMDSLGNVGIGTTTPGAKLDVNGDIRAGFFNATSTTATSTFSGAVNISSNNTYGFTVRPSGAASGLLALFEYISGNSTIAISGNTNGSASINFGQPANRALGAITYRNDGLATRPNFMTFSTAGTERMALDASGNLGIGTSTTSKLSVAGAILSTDLLGGATTLSTDANGNIIRTPSDQKLKTNVETLTSALDKVNAMRGVSYNWIDTSRFGPDKEIGFIAQELETIVPEVVKSGGEYKSVNYQNLTALLTEAIKELSAKVTGFSESFKSKFVEADNIKTKRICVEKSNGGEVCLNGDQLEEVLSGKNVQIIVQPTPEPQQPVVELKPTLEPEPTPEPVPEPVITPPTE